MYCRLLIVNLMIDMHVVDIDYGYYYSSLITPPK